MGLGAEDAHNRRRIHLTVWAQLSGVTQDAVPLAPPIQLLQEFWEKAHLGLMKNLYWIRTVMRKKTTPSTAMAKRFRPTKSQESGDTKRFSPVRHNADIWSEGRYWNHAWPYFLFLRQSFPLSVLRIVICTEGVLEPWVAFVVCLSFKLVNCMLNL